MERLNARQALVAPAAAAAASSVPPIAEVEEEERDAECGGGGALVSLSPASQVSHRVRASSLHITYFRCLELVVVIACEFIKCIIYSTL